MTDITIEKYIESFPHPSFPKQEGEPTYDKIQTIHKLAAANATSVDTTRGGGQHGYLALVLDANTYTTLTGQAFMPPANPGPVPVIAGNTRSAQVAVQENAHKERLREYKEYKAVGKALLQLTTNAFEEKYLRHLKNKYTGFNNVTVLQVFQHLYNTYGNITELELIENEEKMKTPWNQSEPLETVFHQIEEAVEFAQHGNSPFTNNQVLNIAYYIMAQANIFKEACKEWKRAPADQKTWPNFKTLFFQAYVEWREESKYTASEYSGGLANYARDTAEALQSMIEVNAAAEEERTQHMANLTAQNQDLQSQITTLTAQLASMQAILQHLASGSSNNGKPKKPKKKPVAYCWTHGGTFNTAHTSQTCMSPANNHDREATLQDTRGGSKRFL